MDKFSIEIPPDADFYEAVKSSLSSNPSITFAESRFSSFREAEGAAPDILAYIFSFPTAAVFIAALKYLSPVFLEFVKRGRQVTIKKRDAEITVANAKDLDRAIVKANDLLRTERQQKPNTPEE